MATGRVKWFNMSQGYGYIEDSRSGMDVYVHVASLDGARTLQENTMVDYELIETRNGFEAMRVKIRER